jgi:dimethylaniline monooxygenase (N-oxide forming)
MVNEIGISKHPPSSKASNIWDYPSLFGAPEAHPQNEQSVTSIYRGIVQAKNILRRDFAVAGALV